MAASSAFLVAGRPMAGADRTPIRIALSVDTLVDGDLKDARAAYRVWGEQLIGQLCHRCAELTPDIFYPSPQLLQMLRNDQVGCCLLTAREFLRAQDQLENDFFMVEDYAASGLDYLILVHQTSPAQRLEDLKQSRLLVHDHRDTSLLRQWLSVELAELHQPDMEQFFSTVEPHRKVNEVLLPLFFRRAPAIGICRRSYNLAKELNPQLGRDLRVLAASPRFIPFGLWFHRGCDPEMKREIVHGMTILASTPAGKQMITLYDSGQFVVQPGSLMNDTLDLLHQYDRQKHG